MRRSPAPSSNLTAHHCDCQWATSARCAPGRDDHTVCYRVCCAKLACPCFWATAERCRPEQNDGTLCWNACCISRGLHKSRESSRRQNSALHSVQARFDAEARKQAKLTQVHCPPSGTRMRLGPLAKAVKRALLAEPAFLAEASGLELLLLRGAPFGYRGLLGGAAHLSNLVRNATLPRERHFQRCAVVGSARHLLDRDLGECIDSHDTVLRVNLAPVSEQFAASVGRATTWRLETDLPYLNARKSKGRSAGMANEHIVWCHNRYLGRCHFLPSEMPNVHMLSPRYVAVASEVFLLLHKHAMAAKTTSVSQLEELMHALNASMLGVRGEPRRPPSSGLLAVALALAQCRQVNLFGFEVGRDGERSPRCPKYYDPPRCMSTTSYASIGNKYHAWFLQVSALSALHAMGLVRVVDRQVGQ